MKTLRRMSAVTFFSLSLAISVYAGHIETPSAPKPTSTLTATSATTTTSSVGTTTSVMLMIVGFASKVRIALGSGQYRGAVATWSVITMRYFLAILDSMV